MSAGSTRAASLGTWPGRGRASSPPAPRAGGARRRRRSGPSWGALGLTVVVMVVLWQLTASFIVDDGFALSSPTETLRQTWTDRSLLWTNTSTTAVVAVAGFAVGNLVALLIAVVFVQFPLIDRIFSHFALALYALPTLVLAPVLQFLLTPSATRVTVAALVVFFPTLISGVVGLRAASSASVDLVRALGGSRWDVLLRVRLRGALPMVFSGLRVAVPGALLGAIASEWLGADRGLGIFMVNALGYLDTARVYSCVLVLVLLTVLGYALVDGANRVLNGWQQTGREEDS